MPAVHVDRNDADRCVILAAGCPIESTIRRTLSIIFARCRCASNGIYLVEAVDEQLADQPTVETRNRKPMRPNPIAPWELRVGHLRVYYEVQEEPDPVVRVLAVGVKDRNGVRIAGEEMVL